MSNIEDSNDVISITEKVNTLWKTYNNLINTNPTGTAFSETLPFQNFVIDSELFNQNIPTNLLITQDISLDIFNNENILQITININISDISYLTIESLDSIFDANSSIQPGFKCNFSSLGYPYLEYYYKKECYPTISNGGTSKQQIYTWFIPEPSNGDISFPTTKNLLKNTIPNKFDPYNNTYQYRLYQKSSNGTFNNKEFASYPDFAYLDNKSGFLYFYGGQRNGNNVTLNYFRAQSLSDNTKSPPYLSYIKYIGNVGLNNVNLIGNTIIDGSLTLINDLSFSEISNNNYNVLNTKQIKQYVENLNISGGSSGSNNGLTLNEILNSNNDASFTNVDISGNLNILDNNLINYIEYNVTSQGGKYYINGSINPEIFFEIGKNYRFNLSDSTNINHPLRFYSDSNKQNQINDNIIIKGTPGSNGSYVQISITENTSKVFYYQCASHDNMGNKITLMPNFSNKYIFDVSAITTNNDLLQDLSSLFFNTITPSKNNSNILITINVTLYCSYALEERISIELWRDLSMLTQNNNIGSVIATGGLTIPYNLTYLDENLSNTQKKYYLKYKLENNNSQKNMGLINLQTSQNNGFSNFLLREI